MHDRGGSLTADATDAESEAVMASTISGLSIHSKDPQKLLLVI
jgi:hypothetical protein